MHLSIFDLDGTLLKINSSFHFYIFLYKKKLFKRRTIVRLFFYFIRFKYFNMTIEQLHKKVFRRYVKGISLDVFNTYLDKFLDKYLNKAFYRPAIKRLEIAIKEKHHIVILSSSPNFIVKPIAEILKVKEYKATEYSLDKKNRIDTIFCIMDGAKKAMQAKQIMKRLNIKKDDVSVYSDSISDENLFDIATNKIAVRPGKKLKKLALKMGFEII